MNLRLTSFLILLAGLASASADSVGEPTGAPSPFTTPPGAVAQASPTPFFRYEDTGPYHVSNERRPSANPATDACIARRDDVITIWVKHLNSWLNDPRYVEAAPPQKYSPSVRQSAVMLKCLKKGSFSLRM